MAYHAVDWALGYTKRDKGPLENTQTADYNMQKLLREGYIRDSKLLDIGGLKDFAWQVTWWDERRTGDDALEKHLGDGEGYVIFVHGWTGNHTIWEQLPAMIVKRNPRLVAITIDHNGFGQSQFTRDPSLEECNPPAAMRTLENFVETLKLRPQQRETDKKVVNLVGHSMGGATLFYANPALWTPGEMTRYALAPALLLEDHGKQAFYTSLGLATEIVNRISAFEVILNAVTPPIVSVLCAGASDFIKQTHEKQTFQTDPGTTAATFTAMGQLRDYNIATQHFDSMRVMLGHVDALVGLGPMIDLLSKLALPPGNVRVVPGPHYFFSVGADSQVKHTRNRDLVVDDIIDLHNRAYQRQVSGG